MSASARAIAAIAIAALIPTAYARGGGHGGGHSSHASYGGSHSVRSYTRHDGTHIAATRATNPNGTKRDNYSTRGNVNPATGKVGTKSPD